MSFLEALQAKRKHLKSCDTIVTTCTGEQYVESSGSLQATRKLEQQKTYGFVVDTKPDVVPACILKDFLYLGSQDAISLDNIKQYHLSHILSIGIECPLEYLPQGVHNKYVPCLDLPDSSLAQGVLDSAFDFIEQARSSGGRVLVHCNAGVSRSSSVVIAYLMRHKGMQFEQAYRHVKEQRMCIQPNAGFMQQLRAFK